MRRGGEDKHDEREERGDGVDDQDRRQGRPGTGWQVESPRLRRRERFGWKNRVVSSGSGSEMCARV